MDQSRALAPASTLPSPDPSGRARRVDRGVEYAGISVVITVVALALAGVLGVRTSSSSVSVGGLDVRVEHAAVARPGLAAPLTVAIGFDEPLDVEREVEVSIDLSYVALFDENSWNPDPVDSWVTGDRLTMVIQVPAGAATTAVTLDARIEPAVQATRHHATIDVVAGDARATVAISTVVLP